MPHLAGLETPQIGLPIQMVNAASKAATVTKTKAATKGKTATPVNGAVVVKEWSAADKATFTKAKTDITKALNNQSSAVALGSALKTVNDQELYKIAGATSFAKWVESTYGIKLSQAYNMIAAYDTYADVVNVAGADLADKFKRQAYWAVIAKIVAAGTVKTATGYDNGAGVDKAKVAMQAAVDAGDISVKALAAFLPTKTPPVAVPLDDKLGELVAKSDLSDIAVLTILVSSVAAQASKIKAKDVADPDANVAVDAAGTALVGVAEYLAGVLKSAKAAKGTTVVTVDAEWDDADDAAAADAAALALSA